METSTPLCTDTLGASRFTGVPAATLTTMRVRGGGPEYRKIGARVLYAYSDLKSWLDAARRTSTSAA